MSLKSQALHQLFLALHHAVMETGKLQNKQMLLTCFSLSLETYSCLELLVQLINRSRCVVWCVINWFAVFNDSYMCVCLKSKAGLNSLLVGSACLLVVIYVWMCVHCTPQILSYILYCYCDCMSTDVFKNSSGTEFIVPTITVVHVLCIISNTYTHRC